MAPATPSRTLPKSVYHQTVAGTAPGTPVSHAPEIDSDHCESSTESFEDKTDLANPLISFSHFPHPGAKHDYAHTANLVIVCCHAIFLPDQSSPSFPLHSPYDESNWLLAPFQRSDVTSGKPGEHETFLAHIAAGINTLTTGSWAGRSLLVLSGGPTKQDITSLSEARSYYHAALGASLAAGERGGGVPRRAFESGRILLEEHATESFQNLLFSILLFRHTTGRYPEQIRVVTHAFKARRFLDLHAPALHWPARRIRVQGIDPIMSSKELVDTAEGEARFGYQPWQDDPFGVGQALSRKRQIRGWDSGALEEIGKGLEENVRILLHGKIGHEVLPWEEGSRGQGLPDVEVVDNAKTLTSNNNITESYTPSSTLLHQRPES